MALPLLLPPSRGEVARQIHALPTDPGVKVESVFPAADEDAWIVSVLSNGDRQVRLVGSKTVVTVHGLDWQREKWGRFAAWLLRHCEGPAAHFPNRAECSGSHL